jgi:hypothetical protein
MRSIQAALLSALLFFSIGCTKTQPSIQQKVVHKIDIIAVDPEGGEHEDGVCTAVAVGPHVLLTAEHCIEKDDLEVMIDLSMHKYHILAKTTDDNDHIMFAVDGPEFLNYINLSAGSRQAKAEESVFMYGCGGGTYPPRKLTGKQIPEFDTNSEVDISRDVQEFNLPVIGGDSGSPVYGLDGRIIALVTYSHNKNKAIGFGLNFNEQQIYIALYVGKGRTL